MIRIIDATLVMLDDYNPTKEHLLLFCGHMKEIGITDMEISKYVYRTLGELPEGIRFYLHLDYSDKVTDFPGMYRYFMHNKGNHENIICKVQINDVKELHRLKMFSDYKFIQIIGLDDLILYHYQNIFSKIKQYLNDSLIILCPENTYHCATGVAVEWMLSGGKEISAAFSGIGDRAATEEVYMAMNVVKRYKPNQVLAGMVRLKELFEIITGKKIPDYKPVIGNNIFRVESGIHVDGLIKNSKIYVAYPPEKVGQKTEIMLGKHSGSNSIRKKCEVLSLNALSEDSIKVLLRRVRQLSIKKHNTVSDEEFLYLYREVVTWDAGKEDR